MKKTIYRIEDIAEVKSGKRIPKGMSFVNYKTDYKYIRARDIKNGAIHSDELVYIDDEVKKKIDKYIIEENDIAITIVGENIGDVGICPREISGSNLTENACRLTCYKLDKVFPKYLLCYLNQKHMKEHMQLLGSGAAQGKLGNYKTKRMKIELPNLNVQRKIAEEAEKYDCLIENNNKRIKILEQMALELYKEWFVRFRVPFVKLTIEGKIPKDWEYKRIDEMFLTSSGGTPARNNERYYKNGTIPWVKTGELHDSMIFETEENITEEAIKNSAAKIIEPYSLLCSMYAGVGKLGINSVEMTCSQATCVIKPVSYCSIYYLFSWLKLNKLYLENISSGAAQQNISQEIIKKIRFLCPTKEMMRAYDQIVVPMWDEILFLKKKNKILEQQRDLLLPRLMSGKLEIKESE